jgi:DNA-binding FrmR family transcriptional regulator
MAHLSGDKKLIHRVRRIRGQVDGIERALQAESDCSEVLQMIAACRGAMNSLMAQVMEGHIHHHLLDGDHNSARKQAQAAQELIDVIRAYLR